MSLETLMICHQKPYGPEGYLQSSTRLHGPVPLDACLLIARLGMAASVVASA